MSKWNETNEARDFIATADSRKTDGRINDLTDAEAFWNGDFSRKCDYLSIWEHATNNGLLDGYEMFWGAAGNLNSVCGATQPEFAA
jgi:hypothetical protein